MLGSSGGYLSRNGLFSSGEIRKRAQEAEEKANQSFLWTSQKELRFSRAIEDVLAGLEPTPQDRDARAAIIVFMDKFVKDVISGNATIAPYGSYTTNIYSRDSDLDLSLYVNATTRDQKLYYLKRLTVGLNMMKARIGKIQTVYKAIVPVVKFVERKSGIQCDISVDNHDGALKSAILAALTTVDKRFRPLCLLLKKWAKSHGINDASTGTLSSYTITLLMAFHLQTCSPPVLPPLSSLIGGLELRDFSYCSGFIASRAKAYQGYGARNLERVFELFRTFFVKMDAVKELWADGLCASTLHGQWISKWPTFQSGCLWVEDFYDPSKNAAKAVTRTEFEYINQCLQNSVNVFRRPIVDLEAFKKTMFGGGCVSKAPTPPSLTGQFPDPREIRPSIALPLFQVRPHRPASGPQKILR